MAHFTIQPTKGGGWLIDGTDVNGVHNSKALPYDASWDEYQALMQYKTAVPEWDAAVKEFYAPLTDKKAALFPEKRVTSRVRVIEAAVKGKPAVECQLSENGELIEAIVEGNFDILRWVGNDLIALEV